jgi:SSS family solute:Na+ symporter
MQASVLGGLDWAVFATFLGVMLCAGYWMGKEEESTTDFFLGGRSVPGWAVCLSFVATEISALTIIGVPATAYRENWAYLEFFIGNAMARIVIAFLFIPAFYKYECTTIYEFLRHRFGPATQYTASVFFFLTRLVASGVRLYVASAAVALLMGWDLKATLTFFTFVGIAYISWGGIKAVVWTNVIQAVAFIIAGWTALGYIVWLIPGGLPTILKVGGDAGRTQIWQWWPAPTDPQFWNHLLGNPNMILLAVANGLFGAMAAFGTDHDLMQRLLTVKTRKESQRTLVRTILVSFVVASTYLAIGTGLFVFYKINHQMALPAKLENIFPHFIAQVMPAGMKGLMLAAVVLASIDSPLGSLSASFVTDIYRPLLVSGAADLHYLRVGRLAVAGFGVALGLIAAAFSFADHLLWLAFEIVSITFGPLLGVFLFGLTTERRANRANVVMMIGASLCILTLLIASKCGYITLGWSWLLPLGTVFTYAGIWFLGSRLDD